MRTTLQLDDHLITEARLLAAHTGRTLSQVVEDALRQIMAPRQPTPGLLHLPLGSGKLRPGVALGDNADLRDRLDDLH